MKKYMIVIETILLVSLVVLTGCSLKNPLKPPKSNTSYTYYESYETLDESSPEVINSSKAVYKSTMKPYKVRGRWYYPIPANEGDIFVGKASWYGPNFHGRLTSNGEVYNMYKRTAAHKTLPINTYVKVTNLENGRSTIVRINDRGPFVSGRIIDLSYKAAKEIGLIKKGVATVELEVVSSNKIANKYVCKIPKKATKKVAKKDMSNFKNNRYFVQIASIYNKSKAIKLKRKYSSLDKNYRPYLVSRQNNNKKIYKLLIGRFSSKKAAKEFIKKKKLKNVLIVKD